MKIMFLVQLPPPIHGASMVNAIIKNSELINSDFDTLYVNTAPGENIEEIGKFRFVKAISFLKIIMSVIVGRFKFRPDLAYLTLSPYGIAFAKDAILAVLMKLTGTKVIFHMHGKGIAQEVEGSFLKRAIYRAVFRSVDVIHLSESLHKDILPIIDNKRKVYTLNNGIEDLYKSGVKKNNKFTFVYLSNIGPTKGAHILVEASKMLLEQGESNFDVAIYGNSNNAAYYNQIEKEVNSIVEGNVRLCGPVYGQDKYDSLSRGHVFVLPTSYRNECFPLSILEAMSCHLPVISTQEGAIPDIVDSNVGIVLNELSAEELACAMKEMIANRDFYNSASEAARHKYSLRYTIAVFERNVIKIFKDVLA